MDAKEFLLLAKDLRKRNDPAAHRSAISRAYYYAFVSACKFVRLYHPIPENAEAHGILPRLLTNSGDDELRDVSDGLGKLRNHRNEADYTMSASRPEDGKHVDVCLKMAEQVVIDLVAAMNNRPKWDKAVAEMKRCEAAIKK